MRNIYYYLITSMAFLYGGSFVLYGQGQLPVFKKEVEHAIRHNRGIQNAELENKKVFLDREDVKGKLLPKVGAHGMYGYLNSGIDLDVPTHMLPIGGLNLFQGSQKANLSSQIAIGGVMATQVIFSGFQITNGQKALEQKFKAKALMTEVAYDELAKEVVLTFDQLMLLNEVDSLIVDSEKRLGKEHQKVVKAIANGVAIPYDRDKIKLAMLELEGKKAEVQSNRELLYFKLEELTGLPVKELQKVSYSLNTLLISQDGMNTMNRKEIEALEVSQKAYEFVLKKEKGAALPMLFAFGNVSYANAFGTHMTLKDIPIAGDVILSTNHLQLVPNYAVGVGMKWNIFEGKSYKTNVDKAKLDLQINENNLVDTKEKLSLLQRKTQSDYRLSLAKIDVNKQQMQIAKNNLHLASRQFEEGLDDVTERLEAENEYYKQSLGYYNQVLAQRNAAVELLKSNGTLYQTITR